MKVRHRYQVKDAARLSGVSVRTLHHYDEIGLLVPKDRTAAGYRLYSDADLLRLQQIIIGRELGLPLEQIGRTLDDPNFDYRYALQRQREQLQRRARQTASMIRAVDAALDILDKDHTGETMSMTQLFDGFDSSRFETEVTQRWGNTDSYRHHASRTSRYDAQDWNTIKTEQAAIYHDAAAAANAGKSSDSPEATSIAERHRLFIDRWFYPCTKAMHSRLADMYDGDSRFTDNIDRHGPGLAAFLAAAIRANARDRFQCTASH